MKYRVFFEPLDLEAKNSHNAMEKYYFDKIEPPISKILLIDKDGFVIESKRD